MMIAHRSEEHNIAIKQKSRQTRFTIIMLGVLAIVLLEMCQRQKENQKENNQFYSVKSEMSFLNI